MHPERIEDLKMHRVIRALSDAAKLFSALRGRDGGGETRGGGEAVTAKIGRAGRATLQSGGRLWVRVNLPEDKRYAHYSAGCGIDGKRDRDVVEPAREERHQAETWLLEEFAIPGAEE